MPSRARRLSVDFVGEPSVDFVGEPSDFSSSKNAVVVGYDGRPQGRDALALGVSLARALDAPLEVVTVFVSEIVVSSRPAEELRAEASKLAEEGVSEVATVLDATPRTVAARSPAHGLHALAEAETTALLVVGSSHRGALGRVLAGTVATQVLSGAPCPVAMAPQGLAGVETVPLRNIGVAFDGSPEAWTALQRASELALATGGRVRIIHALEPLRAPAVSPLESDRILKQRRARCEMAEEQAVASLPKDVHPESRIVVGAPVQVLEAEAHDGLDLLVMGSRGFGPVRRVLLGSMSSQLVRLAPCPLLVLPRSVAVDPSAEGLAAHDSVSSAQG
jgi:nucleotide-binding universal stress UspA family protein